jgi:hypothetical protein
MLPNSTKSIDLEVDKKDISYLRWTVDSYDGMGAVSTLDPEKAIVRVHLARGCEDILIGLLNYLVQHSDIKIDLTKAVNQILGSVTTDCKGSD